MSWETFILSSSREFAGRGVDGDETETDDNPCDRRSRHVTATGGNRPRT